MKAVASVVLDDQLVIHDVKIIETQDEKNGVIGTKVFLVMPNRKMPDGTYRDVVHPLSAPFRGHIEEAVFAAYRRCVDKK